MAGSIKGAGITEQDFMHRMHERVMPDEFRMLSTYIMRARLLPIYTPPYATDIFVKMTGVYRELDVNGCSKVDLLLEDSDGQMVWTSPVNSEGFIVAPNIGQKYDENLPISLNKVGYLLGKASLSDVDLLLFESKPEQNSTV